MRAPAIPVLALGAAMAAAALLPAGPAGAQAYVDEVVITGAPNVDGRPTSLSQTVSIRDLDLTTYEGREVLRLRVRATARDLCRALGEDRFVSGPLTNRSCEDKAIRDARPQVRLATNQAFARASYAYLEDRYAPYD